MKYISTLIFAAALVMTWNLVHKENSISFETHASIQLKLVDVIRSSVLEIKPLAKDIKILDISTEPISTDSVKAYFTYKFMEPDTEEGTGDMTEQTIKGEALLRRTKGVDPNEDHWTMEDVKTQTGEMTFKNGITITPIAVPGEEEPKTEAQAPTVPVASPEDTTKEAPAAETPVPTPAPEKVYE